MKKSKWQELYFGLQKVQVYIFYKSQVEMN